jgi:hypothetical protein
MAGTSLITFICFDFLANVGGEADTADHNSNRVIIHSLGWWPLFYRPADNGGLSKAGVDDSPLG